MVHKKVELVEVKKPYLLAEFEKGKLMHGNDDKIVVVLEKPKEMK